MRFAAFDIAKFSNIGHCKASKKLFSAVKTKSLLDFQVYYITFERFRAEVVKRPFITSPSFPAR
jgi:hypothetical protein